MPDRKDPNDFRPKRKTDKSEKTAPKVFSVLTPDLEVHIDERELEEKEATVLVCRCDKVCTCDSVETAQTRCRCDTVAKCRCEAVAACTCDSVMVCNCDTVKVCRCNPQCSCDRHSPGGGGSRVCRCVPVRAH